MLFQNNYQKQIQKNDSDDSDQKFQYQSNGEILRKYYKKLDLNQEELQKQEFKQIQLESTVDIEYRIRKKGTFTLSILNITDNLNDQNNKYYVKQKEIEGFNPFQIMNRFKKMRMKQMKKQQNKQKIQEQIEVNGEQYEREDIQKLNLFLEDKIELPNNCKFELSQSEMVSLSQSGKKIKECWMKSGFQESSFIDMQYLSDSEFGEFYICSIKGNKVRLDEKNYSEEEVKRKSKEIMGRVLFGNKERNFISWLEYWVYTCGKGQWVAPYLYMYTGELDYTDKTNIKQITNIVISQQNLLKNRTSQFVPKNYQISYSRSTFINKK